MHGHVSFGEKPGAISYDNEFAGVLVDFYKVSPASRKHGGATLEEVVRQSFCSR